MTKPLSKMSRSELVDGEDMADPANWREGDVVECISPVSSEPEYFTVGRQYTLVENDGSDSFRYIDDEGDHMWCNNSAFKFHHRPAQREEEMM